LKIVEEKLESELQRLRHERHDAWVEHKNVVEEVSSKYFRLSPIQDIFLTVRELIAYIDCEAESEREAEKVTDHLIIALNTFTQESFQNDKFKSFKLRMEPIISELTSKLINQRANNDAKLTGTDFYDLLLILSDCSYNILNGGKIEESNAIVKRHFSMTQSGHVHRKVSTATYRSYDHPKEESITKIKKDKSYDSDDKSKDSVDTDDKSKDDESKDDVSKDEDSDKQEKKEVINIEIKNDSHKQDRIDKVKGHEKKDSLNLNSQKEDKTEKKDDKRS